MSELFKQIYARLPLKRQIFEVVRHVVKLPIGLTQHLHFRGTFTVKIDSSHRFRIEHLGHLVENDLFWNGFAQGYEATSLEVWRRLAPDARVILDVGANTGVYALAARCLNPDAKVIALEPVERVFRRLQRNIDLNGYDINAEQLAASDSTGTSLIHDLPFEHLYSASLDHSMLENYTDVVEYSVLTKRLDDYLCDAGLNFVDLIKIDVEQFEPQVLRGMGNLLANCKPTLLIEILNQRVAREVNDITRNLGYNVFRIIERQGLLRSSEIQATEHEERNYLLAQERAVQTTNIGELVL
jgi:FkbM family methyltransferase